MAQLARDTDLVLRPDGPTCTDTALLGVLLAKTELDAAVRADPAQEPPRRMTGLLTGYHSMVTSPATQPAYGC
ncbi:hypothetical protein ACFWJY_24090 [Streptomyces anulatus]|uniref:hypothetical protein n=1 Tax=Streptomyces anulatus TaxID=1892 RepID=UPI00364E6687